MPINNSDGDDTGDEDFDDTSAGDDDEDEKDFSDEVLSESEVTEKLKKWQLASAARKQVEAEREVAAVTSLWPNQVFFF